MPKTCPYCQQSLSSHGPLCRVPSDLDRFERVYGRLSQDQDNPLRENLLRHLIAFGRRESSIAC